MPNRHGTETPLFAIEKHHAISLLMAFRKQDFSLGPKWEPLPRTFELSQTIKPVPQHWIYQLSYQKLAS